MGLVTHAGTGSRAPGLTVHSGAIIKQGDAQIQLEVETAESLAIAITIQPELAAPARAELASISIVILISVGCVAALVIAWRRKEGLARR